MKRKPNSDYHLPVTSHKLQPCMRNSNIAINNGRLLPLSPNKSHNSNFHYILHKMELDIVKNDSLHNYVSSVINCLNLVVSEYSHFHYTNKEDTNEIITHGRYLQWRCHNSCHRKPRLASLKSNLIKYTEKMFEESNRVL